MKREVVCLWMNLWLTNGGELKARPQLVTVTMGRKSQRTLSSVMIWSLVITFSGLFQNGVR